MDFEENEQELKGTFHQLKVSCYLNILLCYVKLNNHDMAVREADKILEMSPLTVQDQVKTYFRRGLAHKAVHAKDLALEDFKKAFELDGGKDAGVTAEYQNMKNELQAKRDFERRQYSKLFQ